MAEINEIISKEAIQSIKDADSALTKFDGDVMKLIASLKGFSGSGSGLADLNVKIKETADNAKEYNKIQKETIAVQKKVVDSAAKLSKENIQAKQALDAKIAATKLEAKATNEQLSAYDRLAAKVAIARKNYKDLAASLGDTNKSTISAQKEFSKLNNQLDTINKNAGQSQGDVGQYGKIWDGVGKYAAAAGAVFAGVWATIKIGEGVIKTSQYATDAWTKTTEGLKNGWSEFMNSVANWDFSNLIERINEAAQAGRDYAEVVDLMEKRQKGLSTQHKQENEEIAKLRLSYYDHNKSATEKAAIMEKVIQLTQSQSEADAKSAEQNYKGYVSTIISAKKINQATLENYLQFKGTTEEKVQLIEKLKNAENYYNANSGILGENDKSVKNAYKTMIELRVKGVGEYARLETKLSQDQIDKARELYDAVAQTNAAVYENKEGFYRKMELQEKKTEAAATKALDKQIGAYAKLSQSISDMKQQQLDMLAEGKTPSEAFLAELKKQEIQLYNISEAAKNAALNIIAMQTGKGTTGITLGGKSSASPGTIGKRTNTFTGGAPAGTESLISKLGGTGAASELGLDVAKTTADATFDYIRSKDQLLLDSKISDIEKETEVKLKNTKLTEEQKAKIQADADKKIATMRNAAAKKERAAQIIEAIVNGILSVLKAPPGTKIAEGLRSAAMVAAITMQPIPKYDTGTTNSSDTFWAGEKRPEFLQTPSGKLQFVSKPTLFSGMPGSTVISGEDTDRIMKAAGRDGLTGFNFAPSFNRLENKIVDAVKNQSHIHISGRTGRITDRRGNYYTEYFNRMFKS